MMATAQPHTTDTPAEENPVPPPEAPPRRTCNALEALHSLFLWLAVPRIMAPRVTRARSRSSSRSLGVQVGDRFLIWGPGHERWNPDRRRKWQPRIYTGRPGERSSTQISQMDFPIDLTAEFEVLQVHQQQEHPWFVSVRFEATSISRPEAGARQLWINASRNGRSWIRLVPEPELQGTQ